MIGRSRRRVDRDREGVFVNDGLAAVLIHVAVAKERGITVTENGIFKLVVSMLQSGRSHGARAL